MKTAHQFARELLAGPDLPIRTPDVSEYDDSSEDGQGNQGVGSHEPKAEKLDAIDHDGNPASIILIS